MEPLNTVGTALGNDGPHSTIEHGGTVFDFLYPSPLSVARLEQQVARIAMANVSELSGVLGPVEYAQLHTSTLQALTAKKHAFGGELFATITAGSDGPALFLWSYLNPACMASLDQIRDLIAAKPEECTRVIVSLTPDFYRAAAKLRKIPAAAIEDVINKALAAFESRVSPAKFTP